MKHDGDVRHASIYVAELKCQLLGCTLPWDFNLGIYILAASCLICIMSINVLLLELPTCQLHFKCIWIDRVARMIKERTVNTFVGCKRPNINWNINPRSGHKCTTYLCHSFWQWNSSNMGSERHASQCYVLPKNIKNFSVKSVQKYSAWFFVFTLLKLFG